MRLSHPTKRHLLAALVVASTLVFVAPAGAAAGDLDPSYGSGGSVPVNLVGEGGAWADRAVLQTDGKLLIVSFTYLGFVVRRFLPDGSRDKNFGVGGTATIPFDWGNENQPEGGARSVAVQPDGKIVVVGRARTYCSSEAHPNCAYPEGTRRAFAVARLQADGSLDPSFGSPYEGFTGESTGTVRTRFEGLGGSAHAVAIQPDGKIVAAGLATIGTSHAVAVVRYNPDGSLDAAFGSDGTVATTLAGSWARADSVMLQPDGKIVVAGATGDNGMDGSAFLLARYRPDGSPDPSFGNGGVVTTTIDRYAEAPVAVLRPDGRIVAAGYASSAWDSRYRRMALVGYNPDGTVDPGFGDQGTVTTTYGATSVVYDLVLQPDGTLIAAGSTESPGSPTMMALVLYRADGSPGTGFGEDGRVAAGSVSGDDAATALARQSDGKLIAAGKSIKRFLGSQSDPAPDPDPDPDHDPEPAPEPEPDPEPAPDPRPAPTGVTPDPYLDGESTQTGGSDDGAMGPPLSAPPGYWMVDAGGAIHPFGHARHHGAPTLPAGVAAADIEPAPGGGYWILDERGTVHAHGTARHLGDAHRAQLAGGERPTSLSATPTGNGYWIFTTRGRALAFGDAGHHGDMSAVTLNGPVLDSVPTPSGQGYYMVAADGGIFTFGDAVFGGSMGGTRLNAPIQSLVPDGDGSGYWLVASDGGIFAFDAAFRGSLGDIRLNRPITGMVRYGDGYLMVGEDGGIFNFSSLNFAGSLGNNPPHHPVVAVAALD